MTDMPEMGGMPSNDELVPFFTFEDIDHALENGEFCCYLQPKCNAETGTIVGAEALVRWNHPKYGGFPQDGSSRYWKEPGVSAMWMCSYGASWLRCWADGSVKDAIWYRFP